MNLGELSQLHEDTCRNARVILQDKNRDYSGGTDGCFTNFLACEAVLGTPAEIGILMRCLDKFMRIRSFVETGTLAVQGEPVEDAIVDVINYMILLKGIIRDKNNVEKEP